MKLMEYQAKEIFREFKIPVPESSLSQNPDETVKAAEKIGFPCVLKSQVLQGGRGKAGLIKIVKAKNEAAETANYLFSAKHNVKKILVEKAIDIESEIYMAITVDPFAGKALLMGCAEGGMDIEETAVKTPEKIIKLKTDISKNLNSYQILDFLYTLGLTPEIIKKASQVVSGLYSCFKKYDAELVEINPLFITRQGEIVAGDGKLNIDDASMFRQPAYEKTREYFSSDAEYEAGLEGIPYLQFDGDISLMCAGAGLTNAVYDLINYEGGTVANYLEFGGPNYKKAVKAMELCLKNANAKVILIVTFGTIARADVMAEGIRDAINLLKPKIPIVTCIRGTNENEAHNILRSCGLEPLIDTEEAVKKAVSCCGRKK